MSLSRCLRIAFVVAAVAQGTYAGAETPLIPNGVHYRESGTRPVTGRSGSASLQARALLGKDGVTELEVTTGTLDSPVPAPGEIRLAQVKLFDPNGRLSSADNCRAESGAFER